VGIKWGNFILENNVLKESAKRKIIKRGKYCMFNVQKNTLMVENDDNWKDDSKKYCIGKNFANMVHLIFVF